MTNVTFTVDAKPLAAAVAWAARRIPPRPAMPILGGALIDTTTGVLIVAGFDLDVCATAFTSVTSVQPGRALVSGRLLAELVKTLPPAKSVSVSVDDTHLTLTCGAIRLTLPLMPVEDYPELPKIPTVVGRTEAQSFAEQVGRVAVAADTAGVSAIPALLGVLLSFDGTGIRLEATNRYRGAISRTDWLAVNADFPDPVLVPAQVLNDLAGSIDAPEDLAIGYDSGLVSFATAGRAITARLLDRQHFPANLASVVPPRADDPTAVGVADVTAALRRAVVVLTPKAPVRLRFADNTLTVTAGDRAQPAVEEEIPCHHPGPAIDLEVNAGYLGEALAALHTTTAHVTLPPTPRKPILLTAPGDDFYRMFLMPIRPTEGK